MIFNTSKKAHNDKIRLQIIRLVISNRVRMLSTPTSKKAHNDKIRLQIIRLVISNRVRMLSTPPQKAHNDKIRLQIIRLVISNRVQILSTPQKKLITTKYDFKSSVWSFQIESKCFQHLKKSS